MGPNSNILHIWKVYLTLEIIKQDRCANYSEPSKFLFLTYYGVQHIIVSINYCVKQNTVSTLAFNRTCSTFLCRHVVVISCFALHSPFLICKQVHTHIDIACFCEEKIKIIFQRIFVLKIDGLGWFMVFNATFNNILVIL